MNVARRNLLNCVVYKSTIPIQLAENYGTLVNFTQDSQTISTNMALLG